MLFVILIFIPLNLLTKAISFNSLVSIVNLVCVYNSWNNIFKSQIKISGKNFKYKTKFEFCLQKLLKNLLIKCCSLIDLICY